MPRDCSRVLQCELIALRKRVLRQEQRPIPVPPVPPPVILPFTECCTGTVQVGPATGLIGSISSSPVSGSATFVAIALGTTAEDSCVQIRYDVTLQAAN